MIRTIIVEDDPLHCQALNELLEGTSIPVKVLSVCTTIDSAFDDITELKPDLIFLDIELNGESGFDLLKKFEKPDFAVIFTTQHDNTHNAVSALRACALDFLSKPLQQAELETALARFNKNRKEGVEQTQTLKNNLTSPDGKVKAICIRSTEGQTKIDTDNILYCESDNVVTFFYLLTPIQKKGKYVSSDSIKHWEKSLENSDICRVHREYLANLKYVDVYNPNGGGAILTMRNGAKIPVSKSRRDELNERREIYRKSRQ